MITILYTVLLGMVSSEIEISFMAMAMHGTVFIRVTNDMIYSTMAMDLGSLLKSLGPKEWEKSKVPGF